MALCQRSSRDPLLKDLVDRGINLILPPRANITAGHLLIADDRHRARLARWKSVVGVEVLPDDVEQPSFRSVAFDTSAGLEVGGAAQAVGAFLESVGLKEPSLSAALAKAGVRQLKLRVLAPAVRELANLDEILDTLRDEGASILPGYQDKRLYVVTYVWRGRGLNLEVLNEAGGSADLTGELKDLVSVGGKLTISKKGAGQYDFVADEPLVFGVTLREIVINDGTVTDKAGDVHIAIKSVDDAFSLLGDEMAIDVEVEDS